MPSLDGLRAVSILAVIVHHLALWYPALFHFHTWHVAVQGRIGVDMFFVISGFLITLLLLRERRARQSISIKSFYLRRTFRIVPAYLLFCLGVVVFRRLWSTPLPGWQWAMVLTYTTDFFLNNLTWSIGHTWSLSVEEHFYLIWPVVVCYFPRQAIWGAIGCIIAAPFFRLFLFHHPNLGIDGDYFTLTRWDCIAMGCVLAYAMTSGRLDGLDACPTGESPC